MDQIARLENEGPKSSAKEAIVSNYFIRKRSHKSNVY